MGEARSLGFGSFLGEGVGDLHASNTLVAWNPADVDVQVGEGGEQAVEVGAEEYMEPLCITAYTP